MEYTLFSSFSWQKKRILVSSFFELFICNGVHSTSFTTTPAHEEHSNAHKHTHTHKMRERKRNTDTDTDTNLEAQAWIAIRRIKFGARNNSTRPSTQIWMTWVLCQFLLCSSTNCTHLFVECWMMKAKCCTMCVMWIKLQSLRDILCLTLFSRFFFQSESEFQFQFEFSNPTFPPVLWHSTSQRKYYS